MRLPTHFEYNEAVHVGWRFQNSSCLQKKAFVHLHSWLEGNARFPGISDLQSAFTGWNCNQDLNDT